MTRATRLLDVEQENLEKAKALYADFKRGDLVAVLMDVAENVELVPSAAPDIPYSGVRHGKAEVEQWFADLTSAIDFHIFEPHEYVVQDETVVVLIHSEGLMRHNGIPFRDNPVHVLTYRDGKCVRFRIFSDTQAHLDAWLGN